MINQVNTMESLALPWITTTLITLILYFYTRAKYGNKNPMKKLAPQAGGGWPLVGHLPILSGPDPLHITFSHMADKYGPIFSIGLGTTRGLIINSWEMAKECYRTNDVAFSNRPSTAAIGLMGYDFAMFGFSNYGPYWREMCKISVLQLLSNRKVHALGPVREAQTRAMMRKMKRYSETEKAVDMRKVFSDLSLGLMSRMVAGDVEARMGSEERERWRETIRGFFKMMTVFTVSDVLPRLKWVDRIGGMHEAFKRTGREFDGMLQTWLEEVKKSDGEYREDEGFMTEMLSVANDVAREFPSYDADTINKATCLTMLVGGTDTGTVALTWVLSLLLDNRHTLKRAQQELDLHVGRDRLVQESDLQKLVYIQAIVKETLRLQPPIPVNPREAKEDCVLAGYHIPKGTRVFVNTWKIQRDPRVWVDPLEFKPERFLTSHKEVDVHGQHFELLPFGGGRRVCPAISFALRTAQLAIATLVQGFDVDTPSGCGEAVDMKGSFGTTNMKATPLDVCLKPRLSPRLYE